MAKWAGAFALACLLVWPTATSGAPPGRKVVVQASWSGGHGGLGYMALRRLLAWRKGDLTISRYNNSTISLDVKRVIEGSLPDDYVHRPVGVRGLKVVVIGTAALAADENWTGHHTPGRWALQPLPDGSFVIDDVRDTPLKRTRRDEPGAVRRIETDLKSGDPKRQYQALRWFAQRKRFGLVPAVLGLLDSTAKVTVPDAIRVRTADGRCLPVPDESTLGAEARKILAGVTGPLRDRHSPTARDGQQVWRAWWANLLAAEPFPKIRLAPGRLTELAALPTNQSTPQLLIDPRGGSAFLVMTRLPEPIEGTRNAIQFVSLRPPGGRRFVYKVPPAAGTCEPRGVVAAWGSKAVALAWHEFNWDAKRHVVRFLTLGQDGKPTHEPTGFWWKTAHHLALCPAGEGWLLVFNTKGGGLLAQRLDEAGRPVGGIKRLVEDGQAKIGYHLGVTGLSMVGTPSGAALAFGDRKGVYLLLLDGEPKIGKRLSLGEPDGRGYGLIRVGWNGKRLCAVWQGPDDYVWHARLYDANGSARTRSVEVAEHCVGMARPVADGDGFVLVWRGFEQAPHQVRARRLDASGNLTPAVTVYNGKAPVEPIAAGMRDGMLYVLLRDRSRWPFRVLLKEVPRSALTGKATGEAAAAG